jgi:hypothetical protein
MELYIKIIALSYISGIFVSSIFYYFWSYSNSKLGIPAVSTKTFIYNNVIWPIFWARVLIEYIVILASTKAYALVMFNLNKWGDELKTEILSEIKEESLKSPEEIKNARNKIGDELKYFLDKLKEIKDSK